MKASAVQRWWGLLVVVVSLWGGRLQPQALVWENFDDYETGAGISGQGPWTTWDGIGPDASVTDEESYTEPNALRLDPTSDVVVAVTGATAGQWTARAMTYVPSDMIGDAFFILLNTYSQGGGKNWSTQVKFNNTLVSSAGGTDFARTATLPVILDEWVEIRVEIDLDANLQTIYYNGEVLDVAHQWQQSGILEVQAFDLFSDTASGFYYDNVVLHEACSLSITVEPPHGPPPLDVTFDAEDAECPSAEFAEYEWDFGDNHGDSGAKVAHTYEETGAYEVRLVITDEDEVTYTTSTHVLVDCTGADAPAPWTAADVGEPEAASCLQTAGDCFDLFSWGAGYNVYGDKMQFLHIPVQGDFSVTARISDADWELGAMAGLMARTSLDAKSIFLFQAVTRTDLRGEDQVLPIFGWRSRDERAPLRKVGVGDRAPPEILLRLERQGEEVAGSISADGQTWEEVRNQKITDLPDDLLVGLAVTSGGDYQSARVEFCDLSGFEAGEPQPQGFRRGDADDNGSVQLTDAVKILNHLFLGGDAPSCAESADSDDDGQLAITDAIGILNFLFLGGPEPATPGPAACGPDPEGSEDLGCEAYESC